MPRLNVKNIRGHYLIEGKEVMLLFNKVVEKISTHFGTNNLYDMSSFSTNVEQLNEDIEKGIIPQPKNDDEYIEVIANEAISNIKSFREHFLAKDKTLLKMMSKEQISQSRKLFNMK